MKDMLAKIKTAAEEELKALGTAEDAKTLGIIEKIIAKASR